MIDTHCHLDQEEFDDKPVQGPQALHGADFAKALGDRHEHGVGDADAADQQGHDNQPGLPGSSFSRINGCGSRFLSGRLLALLASRGGGYPLGLHIYILLLLGFSIQEMLDTILLAGIYTGIPEMTQAYRDVARTLEQLRIAAQGGRSACTLAAVNERLDAALR